MNPDDIEWRTGRVRFWDLAVIDEGQPLAAQAHELKEDLAQIEYPAGVVLDIGWYPSFSERGAFKILVVRDEDWDQPLAQTTCSTVAALRKAILESIVVAAEAAETKP